jgi:hypothetical protein
VVIDPNSKNRSADNLNFTTLGQARTDFALEKTHKHSRESSRTAAKTKNKRKKSLNMSVNDSASSQVDVGNSTKQTTLRKTKRKLSRQPDLLAKLPNELLHLVRN